MQDRIDDSEELRKVVDPEVSTKREIYFWPEYARGVDKMNREAAEGRASVLFDSDFVKDPLNKTQSHRFWPGAFQVGGKREEVPASFKLVPSRFLERAKEMSPKKPQATASAFSQWVYSLYGNAFGDNEDRERGKEVEQVILDRRRKAACSIDEEFLSSTGSDWKLIHNGLHLDDVNETRFLEISHLRVNGEPIRASPDLLYKNDIKSEVVIVEIKHSRLPITTNLWPNVWAQLWCYAQLEIVQSARKTTVVGEVWGERWTRARGQGRKRVEGDPLLCLRASVRRDPRAPAYDRFFRHLFEIYRGEC